MPRLFAICELQAVNRPSHGMGLIGRLDGSPRSLSHQLPTVRSPSLQVKEHHADAGAAHESPEPMEQRVEIILRRQPSRDLAEAEQYIDETASCTQTTAR